MSDALESPGGNVHFLLDLILVEMEGREGCAGPIPSIQLMDLVSGGGRGGGRGKLNGGKGGGGGGSGGGGSGGGGSGGGGGGSGGSSNGDSGGGSGGRGSGGGVSAAEKEKSHLWGGARVRVRYNAHLIILYIQGGEKSRAILAGTVLPTLHRHVLCKN